MMRKSLVFVLGLWLLRVGTIEAAVVGEIVERGVEVMGHDDLPLGAHLVAQVILPPDKYDSSMPHPPPQGQKANRRPQWNAGS